VAGDDVTITIRANNGQAVRAFRDVNGHLRDMRGRFVSESSIMSAAMNRVSKSVGSLIPVAAAAVPVTAALGVAVGKAAGATGGAVLALSAFGAAIAGQVSSLSAASEAQTKYSDAVVKSGRGSKEAAEAQHTLSTTLSRMPVSTARAAVGMQTLKDGFQDWSDSIADFTMTPVEKSFTLLNELVPKLTPMARGASEQLDRLVSVAGGAVASPGFDGFADRVSTFANDSLRDAVTGIIRFSTALADGDANGPVKAFMDYAAQNGPAVRETLSNAGDAVVTLAEAAADAGPGMLTLVNAVAKLVAALPPELVTIAMQTAVGLKLMSLAGAGVAATAAGVGKLRDAMLALSAASAAAGGGVRGARAAIGTLSTSVKGGLIAAGIVAVGLGVAKLAEQARGAPPDVDRLTTSLKNLASTGKFTGELKQAFGDLDGLVEDIGKVGQSAQDQEEYVKSFGNSGIGPLDDLRRGANSLWQDFTKGEDSLKSLDDRFGALDQSLASMVDSGFAGQAAADFRLVKDAALEQGHSLKEVEERVPEYLARVAGLKAEQQLAADSMSVFGQAALDTSAKLGAQKESADGLRASILALNDVNRSAYDAQIGFEQSLDDLTASFKEHGATLDLDTDAGRRNGEAMSAAAKSQDELIATGLAAGESLGSMTKKSDELRETMMRLAVDAFDGNKAKAREYVNELLGVPGDIKTLVKLEREEAIAGLKDVQAEIDKTPGAKSVKVDTLNGAAIAALEAVGLKTKQLPDGKTQVFTANGQALGPIGSVRQALDSLNGKTANTYVKTTYTRQYNYAGVGAGTARSGLAAGGLAPGYAGGGNVQSYPDGGLIRGPGTPTSDSILMLPPNGGAYRASDREYIVQASAVSKYGVPLLDALNSGRLKLAGFAKGGVTKKEREARSAARGELTVSHFGRMAGFKNPEIRNQIGDPDSVMDLVKALNKWRSVIKKTTHGAEESRLLRWLNNTGKALLMQEKKLLKVNKALDGARDKLSDLKGAASQLKTSVASGIVGGANITRAAGAEDSRVTINTILSQMQGSAANSGQFSGMLKQLKGRGLRGDLIEQIAEAGIDGGGMETAAAILGGGKGEIRQLNTLQKQIKANAKTAGAVAADAMYGAGIKAAEGLVKGLASRQKIIEKGMMRIAFAMERGIKHALKIKSPSQVMETIGGQTAEGFAQGIQRNRSVQPAWASMLNMPRNGAGGGRPGGTAGGGQPIVVHQTITLDGRIVARQIFDPLREEIAHRGGIVQQAMGRN
jgi:hypothetical protein